MKTVLITGASRGIGAAIARAAAHEGYNVVINYNKNAEAARGLEAELSQITATLVVQADISKAADAEQLVALAEKRFGKITHLVNNAGVSVSGLLNDMDLCQYDSLIDTNLRGLIYLTRLVSGGMVKRQEGNIVNISSIWGKSGASCEAVYSATKAGVIGFTEAMAKELGPSGVRVNAVCPGVIDTDMCKCYSEEERKALAESTALGRLGTPEDVANLVIFLMSDKAAFITGQAVTVDGGFL